MLFGDDETEYKKTDKEEVSCKEEPTTLSTFCRQSFFDHLCLLLYIPCLTIKLQAASITPIPIGHPFSMAPF